MILMANLPVVAPTVALAEAVKVPMTAKPWQAKNATILSNLSGG